MPKKEVSQNARVINMLKNIIDCEKSNELALCCVALYCVQVGCIMVKIWEQSNLPLVLDLLSMLVDLLTKEGEGPNTAVVQGIHQLGGPALFLTPLNSQHEPVRMQT